ncbi:urease accessory protein UreD [Umbelopsis sp. PMI_123]|nr:urease accessory protein UreD [Umbelopsis sp. PMI_123]
MPLPVADRLPGSGSIICNSFGTTTKFTRCHAQYPLKFIPTSTHTDNLAAAYILSYGGGMLSGDEVDMTIELNKDASLLLMTQGSTKIYKDREQSAVSGTPISRLPGREGPVIDGASQTIDAFVSPTSKLLLLPDPVTSFKHSIYNSYQRIHLTSDSTNTSQLVLLDWFTSGRIARGEKWHFKKYASKIDVRLDGRLLIRDNLVLEDENKEWMPRSSFASRLHPHTCFATLIMIAPGQNELSRVVQDCVVAFDRLSISQVKLPKHLIWSLSRLRHVEDGIMVRVAGTTTEVVKNFLKKEALTNIESVIGHGMYEKLFS